MSESTTRDLSQLYERIVELTQDNAEGRKEICRLKVENKRLRAFALDRITQQQADPVDLFSAPFAGTVLEPQEVPAASLMGLPSEIRVQIWKFSFPITTDQIRACDCPARPDAKMKQQAMAWSSVSRQDMDDLQKTHPEHAKLVLLAIESSSHTRQDMARRCWTMFCHEMETFHKAHPRQPTTTSPTVDRLGLNLLFINRQVYSETNHLFSTKEIEFCSPNCFDNFSQYMSHGGRHRWMKTVRVHFEMSSRALDDEMKSRKKWNERTLFIDILEERRPEVERIAKKHHSVCYCEVDRRSIIFGDMMQGEPSRGSVKVNLSW